MEDRPPTSPNQDGDAFSPQGSSGFPSTLISPATTATPALSSGQTSTPDTPSDRCVPQSRPVTGSIENSNIAELEPADLEGGLLVRAVELAERELEDLDGSELEETKHGEIEMTEEVPVSLDLASIEADATDQGRHAGISDDNDEAQSGLPNLELSTIQEDELSTADQAAPYQSMFAPSDHSPTEESSDRKGKGIVREPPYSSHAEAVADGKERTVPPGTPIDDDGFDDDGIPEQRTTHKRTTHKRTTHKRTTHKRTVHFESCSKEELAPSSITQPVVPLSPSAAYAPPQPPIQPTTPKPSMPAQIALPQPTIQPTTSTPLTPPQIALSPPSIQPTIATPTMPPQIDLPPPEHPAIQQPYPRRMSRITFRSPLLLGSSDLAAPPQTLNAPRRPSGSRLKRIFHGKPSRYSHTALQEEGQELARLDREEFTAAREALPLTMRVWESVTTRSRIILSKPTTRSRTTLYVWKRTISRSQFTLRFWETHEQRTERRAAKLRAAVDAPGDINEHIWTPVQDRSGLSGCRRGLKACGRKVKGNLYGLGCAVCCCIGCLGHCLCHGMTRTRDRMNSDAEEVHSCWRECGGEGSRFLAS